MATTTYPADPSRHNLVPGTTQLIDPNGALQTVHASKAGIRDVILIPTPSQDPDDPLNWSASRKALSCSCMCAYVFTVGIASAAIYSVLDPVSQELHLSLNYLNAGTGYMFLAFGWSCLFWQPLAIQYGKRPVFLLTVLATSMIQVWAPHTRSNGQWIANKVLQGFFGGPIESLCEIWVADIYFQHERGSFIALYGLLLTFSSYVAPLISGFIADGQGWQWVLYWCAVFNAVCFVFLLFFMEETNYASRMPATKASAFKHEFVPTLSGGRSVQDMTAPAAVDDTGPQNTNVVHQHKSYLAKLSLYDHRSFRQPKHLLERAWRPLALLSFPLIFWSGFMYGAGLILFNVLNDSAALILGGPPYSFRPSLVGLAYIGPIVGVLLAHLYTGPFGDHFAIWLARRRGGMLEAEFRLWLFVPSLLLVPFGLILWGVGAAHSVHWFGEVFAMGVIAATAFIALQLPIAYCLDAYYALASEAVVTVILIRNTMSFAVAYGITPWLKNMGYQNAFIVCGFSGLAVTASFGLVLKWGKHIRIACWGRYEKAAARVETDAKAMQVEKRQQAS